SSGGYSKQAVCYWYLGQPMPAVEALRQSDLAPYTDAAGGVQPPALLLYAAERLQNEVLRKEALSSLHKFAQSSTTNWPAAIAAFLVEEIGTAELEDSIESQAQAVNLKIRWHCQADFYIALRALREGNRQIFIDRMTQSAESTRGELEDEYYFAKWE